MGKSKWMRGVDSGVRGKELENFLCSNWWEDRPWGTERSSLPDAFSFLGEQEASSLAENENQRRGIGVCRKGISYEMVD